MNAIGKVQENIFRHHLEGCVHDSLAAGDRMEKENKIEEILELISRFRAP
jgi:DNA-binding FrmR family transcriptional regulator